MKRLWCFRCEACKITHLLAVIKNIGEFERCLQFVPSQLAPGSQLYKKKHRACRTRRCRWCHLCHPFGRSLGRKHSPQRPEKLQRTTFPNWFAFNTWLTSLEWQSVLELWKDSNISQLISKRPVGQAVRQVPFFKYLPFLWCAALTSESMWKHLHCSDFEDQREQDTSMRYICSDLLQWSCSQNKCEA